MTLHRLTSVTMGVPNVEETISYYSEFGLTHTGCGGFPSPSSRTAWMRLSRQSWRYTRPSPNTGLEMI